MNNKPRKWWIAGLLSLFEPGLGQIYNGQAKKGLFFLLIPFLMYPSMIIGLKTENIFFMLILFVIFVAVYYIAVIADAVYFGFRFGTDYSLKRYNKIIVYIGVITAVIIVNIAVSGSFKNNYVQAFRIPSSSNEPTLLIGDQILVDRGVAARNPKRGDLIAFKFPEDPNKDFVKRVVAVNGDVVEVKNKILFVNNIKKKEAYVIHRDMKLLSRDKSPRDNMGPITVPANTFFVMGDNRDNSYDSRFWGCVEASKIKGTVKTIYWSWDKEKFNVRWSRIGTMVE